MMNEIILSYSKKKTKLRIVRCPMETVDAAREIYRLNKAQIELKEYFFVIFLNNANEVLGYNKLSEGGITGTVADLRLIFATALKCLANGIVLLHNHPSGNIEPSDTDIRLTEKIKNAGNLLDVKVLDHLILTKNNYYSFVSDGRM